VTDLIPLPRLTSLDDAANPLCQGVVAVSRAAAAEAVGDPETGLAAADLVLLLAEPAHEAGYCAVALEAGEVIGFATVLTHEREMATVAELNVVTHPRHRARGIGSSLLAWAEGLSARLGRTTLQGAVPSRPPLPGAATVTASSGGTFPADVPGWRFAEARGYAIGQIEAHNALDLPVPAGALDDWLAQCRSQSGDYRWHTWQSVVPDEWLGDFAALRTQVTSDAPVGDMAWETEDWSADRLRTRFAEWQRAGLDSLYVVAEHAATQTLAGFTHLVWREHPARTAFQGYTFVRADHRGHRLGLGLKARALQGLAQREPAVSRIYTENAAENAAMLAINRRLGFRLASVAAWIQKAAI